MPLFDYRCSACGHDFELLVRASSTPACPRCASTALDKQLSRIAPAGQTAAIVSSARRAAAKEGHFSHYSRAERAKLPR